MRAVREQFKRDWWNAEAGKVHSLVMPYVRTVENVQADFFNKLVKLEATYDVNPRTNRYVNSQNGAGITNRNNVNGATTGYASRAIMTENLIATNVDTVAANVADADIQIRVQTDGADWSHQRTAVRLQAYGDGLATLHDVGDKCRFGFKMGGAMKGTGINKVWRDRWDQLNVTEVPIDNIIVDEMECRDGRPKQIHYRDFFDRESLAAQFPEYADEIAKAQTAGDWRLWAGYRPLLQNELVVLESWRLPLGPKGHKLYVPGRHTLVIDGIDLLDEPYHKPHFPFSVLRWNRPGWGFYGIGLAERIMPHQNTANRRAYQINVSIDNAANPIKYIKQADQNLQAKTIPQIGPVAVYNDAVPQTLAVPILNAEVYQNQRDNRENASRETGISQIAQQAAPPPGIDSGVGVRELRTDRSQRFSIQEKAFERFWLDTVWLMLDCCKDLGDKAPDILRVSKFGNTTIKWADVDMGDLKIELAAASTLGNSPAGREQRIQELSMAGVITLDESRALLKHPDIDRVMSLYAAAFEDIEWTIERILDGETGVVPEPYQNLKLGVWKLQQQYLLLAPQKNVPETVLESLSDWISVASGILNPPQLGPGPGVQSAMPGPQGAPQLPPGAPPPPVGGAAAGAFAPGAYNPLT